MSHFKPILHKKFNRLTVVEEIETGSRRSVGVVCDCGTRLRVKAGNLTGGRTKSCGCARNGNSNAATHGQTKSLEYNTWRAMIVRCYDSKHKSYADYGGRGVTVCDSWRHSFEQFLLDMGKRPTSLHTLDRFPNVNGNYEPDNCRWATAQQQAINRRSTIIVEHEGRSVSLGDLCRLTGIKRITLDRRYRYGDRGDRLVRPVRAQSLTQ